jgi:hypothetical protein
MQKLDTIMRGYYRDLAALRCWRQQDEALTAEIAAVQALIDCPESYASQGVARYAAPSYLGGHAADPTVRVAAQHARDTASLRREMASLVAGQAEVRRRIRELVERTAPVEAALASLCADERHMLDLRYGPGHRQTWTEVADVLCLSERSMYRMVASVSHVVAVGL